MLNMDYGSFKNIEKDRMHAGPIRLPL